jgi:hypothetical protein
MQITSVNNASFQPAGAAQSMARLKQSFRKLGNALASGDLSAAKDVLAELKKNGPAQADDRNPMNQKMEALSEAVESGDLKAAQQAYADLKKTTAQRPGAGGGAMGATSSSGRAAPNGPRAGGAPPSGGGQKSSATSSSSSSSKAYDERDTNKDGTVSVMEEIEYRLKHPEEGNQSSDRNSTFLDVVA